MPDQLQLRGGTTSEHNSFTGALREVTVDTTKKTLVVHDGSQAGGTPLMKESGTVDPTSITIGTGGTQRLAISNTEVVLNDTGADVDFRVESDTNTHAIFVNAGNSRVGINTSAPNDALEVTGDVQVTSGAIKVTGASPGVRFTDTADTGGFGHVGVNNSSGSLVMRSDDGNALSNSYMGFEVDGGTKMYITSAGNVGIGLTNPSYKLEVSGNCQIIPSGGTQFPFVVRNDFTPNSYRADLFSGNNVTSNNSLKIGTVASNGGVTFQGVRANDSAQKVHLILQPDGGKVGIGDLTPSVTLETMGHNQVTFGTMPETIITYGMTSAYNSGSAGGGIQFGGKYASNDDFTIFGGVHAKKENTTDGHYAGALLFSTRVNGGNSIERMRVHSNGDVNIADGDLHVNGTSNGIVGLGVNNATYGAINIKVGGADGSGSNNVATFVRPAAAGGICLQFPSGGGIDFNPTSDATGGTSEFFDDYEEGQWTATIIASTQAFSSNPSITTNYGRYVKIGRQVHCDLYLQWGNDGAGGSGHPRIGGLPFTEGSHGTYPGVYYGWHDLANGIMSSDENLTGYVQNNGNYVVMYKSNNAGSSNVVNVATMCNSAGGNFQMSFTYMAIS